MDDEDKDDEKERIIGLLLEWFLERYEDPVHSQPWTEGGYVWLVRRCDAAEDLEENFQFTPYDLIQATVQRLEEQEDCFEWVCKADLDKMSE